MRETLPSVFYLSQAMSSPGPARAEFHLFPPATSHCVLGFFWLRPIADDAFLFDVPQLLFRRNLSPAFFKDLSFGPRRRFCIERCPCSPPSSHPIGIFYLEVGLSPGFLTLAVSFLIFSSLCDEAMLIDSSFPLAC